MRGMICSINSWVTPFTLRSRWDVSEDAAVRITTKLALHVLRCCKLEISGTVQLRSRHVVEVGIHAVDLERNLEVSVEPVSQAFSYLTGEAVGSNGEVKSTREVRSTSYARCQFSDSNVK